MSGDRDEQLTHDPSHDEAVAGVGDDGLVTVRSGLSVPDAIDRIAATVTSEGMQVFARIDHAGAAARRVDAAADRTPHLWQS